jgi:hypothetical protein
MTLSKLQEIYKHNDISLDTKIAVMNVFSDKVLYVLGVCLKPNLSKKYDFIILTDNFEICKMHCIEEYNYNDDNFVILYLDEQELASN